MSENRHNKFDNSPEETRPYKLTHQVVSITEINLQKKTYIGVVELTFIPKRCGLRAVKINVRGTKVYSVMLNGTFKVEEFDYYDLTMDLEPPIEPGEKENNCGFSLQQLAAAHRDAVLEGDADAGGGELIVRLPSQASHLIVEGRPFRLSIEFSVENPTGGVHFFMPQDPESLEKAHMFTTKWGNNSRLWFPCIDSTSEVCTWKLEFTVDQSQVAVSVGDLVDVVQADRQRKTYHYFLSVPTAAPNIGLAIGPFEIYVDPNMHEVTHFCPPGLMNLLRWTSRFLHEVFEFYEETLAARFPFPCFKCVFVNEPFEEMISYSSMCILNINLLHTSSSIDQTYVTRRFSSLAIAEQFYSCFISMHGSGDSWLSSGISRYLAGLYIKKFFGNNEYRHYIYTQLQEVIQYEQQYGGIILDPSLLPQNQNSTATPSNPNPNAQNNGGEGGFYFSLQNPQTISSLYLKVHAKKAHLIIRMLEHRIGNQLLLQVLNKQLSLASIYITQSQQSGMGLMPVNVVNASNAGVNVPPGPGSNPSNPMLISTSSFTRAIFTVTGKDMTVFMDQWVRLGGHVRFHMSFIFNRKRNTVELELKQECVHQLGVRKYVGPLTVSLQELDGTFKHVLQIEGTHAKADIVCHSKSRRQKKKKIPLCTGEEVDMDLSGMDSDSPVLWLRLDPDMTLLRHVDTRQPDFQWHFQLRHERDVTAQAEAIAALELYPSPPTRTVLTDIIENENFYYKIRCDACFVLAKVANQMVSTWTGPPAMLSIFRKLFVSFSCSTLVKQNDFSNLQHYFLQKTIPVAMGRLRSGHGLCPPDVLKFLLELFKFNDNSKNRFADHVYRGQLVRALAATVTPAVSPLAASAESADAMPSDTRAIMEELTRILNLEKALPSYKYTLTVHSLAALRTLQKFGHIPNTIDLFKPYAQYGQFYDVRVAALEAIVDYTKTDGSLRDAEYLMEVIETDPVPKLKHDLIRIIIDSISEKSIDRKKKSPFNNRDIALRLWEKITKDEFCMDSRVRCDLIDLYFTLFGSRKPLCLLEGDQHGDSASTEQSSRRKSVLTTREGVDEENKKDGVELIVDNGEVMVSARVLSSKRESMASDNSVELPPEPEPMDVGPLGPMGPTSFEGLFKPPSPGASGQTNDDNGQEGDDGVSQNVQMDVVVGGEEAPPRSTASSSTVKKEKDRHHHHHHHSKLKKKEKKKKHKHKHKHHKHHEHHSSKHKPAPKEETLSSASSASGSPK